LYSYKLDAKTGVIVAQRNLHIPFIVTDLYPCADINPVIGVTGTGVIDPATGTWYLIAKTYVDQTLINVAQGRPAGRQILHAISVEDLTERTNFPVDLEGTAASNNPTRTFNGGVHHQRPALLHYGNYIYAGLGSHCVQYNFTGWIMGWDKTTGQTVARFATQGLGVTNQVEGAGVWMVSCVTVPRALLRLDVLCDSLADVHLSCSQEEASRPIMQVPCSSQQEMAMLRSWIWCLSMEGIHHQHWSSPPCI